MGELIWENWCGRIDVGELMWERELIDEKVDDNCTFVWKNKIRAETRVQFLVMFHHVTLITTNEKFSSRANWSARTLNFCLYPPSYKNPPLHFVPFRALELCACPHALNEIRLSLKLYKLLFIHNLSGPGAGFFFSKFCSNFCDRKSENG